jgi:hypothetical protein
MCSSGWNTASELMVSGLGHQLIGLAPVIYLQQAYSLLFTSAARKSQRRSPAAARDALSGCTSKHGCRPSASSAITLRRHSFLLYEIRSREQHARR